MASALARVAATAGDGATDPVLYTPRSGLAGWPACGAAPGTATRRCGCPGWRRHGRTFGARQGSGAAGRNCWGTHDELVGSAESDTSTLRRGVGWRHVLRLRGLPAWYEIAGTLYWAGHNARLTLLQSAILLFVFAIHGGQTPWPVQSGHLPAAILPVWHT